ncbi:GDSL-type esterase/lipase family protein [Marinobacter sp. 1_MG-2023]|uniref:GDSL-type esterase/lipase family protein n=1 Tax=Marinobacter sp. 1_MG-2023 TaxID=3062627 RepID=UPI0026E31EB3|nr:GDSL-type esterase/lipase family protein [Marinobacter sp. 1_MG-2023]MDO6824578.1 hypothetical protein [Marinobacter sp. 1_MG-2023]
MLTGAFKFNVLILSLILATLGYLTYLVFEGRTDRDGKVTYFLKNTEIIQLRRLVDLPDTAIPFYGDSLVHGLAVSRANFSLENFGIGHDHSSNLLHRVREGVNHTRLSEYAVAIGINDISNGVAVGKLYHNIVAIVESLAFSDAIYLHTVLPVANTRASASVINEKVRKINDLLSGLSVRHKNVVIVNTYKALAPTGFLPENLHIGDGLHLNSSANRKWIGLLSDVLSDRQRKGWVDGNRKN